MTAPRPSSGGEKPDIVRQLRAWAEGPFGANNGNQMFTEAADAIESLTAENAALRKERDAYRDSATARDRNEDALRVALAPRVTGCRHSSLQRRAGGSVREW